MGKKLIISSIVVLVFVAIIVLASINKSPANTGNAIRVSGEDSVKEFVIQSFTEVVDEKYYPQYSLKEISVKKGDLVRIKITNIRGTHDFNIDEFNIHAETPLNEEIILEFRADKAGNFEYYCSKPGHKQNGHWGTLKVQ